MVAAVGTQPLFVAKVTAQNNFGFGLLDIFKQTAKQPFKGSSAGVMRELFKAPIKLGAAYSGNYFAQKFIYPLHTEKDSSSCLASMNVCRGAVAGVGEGTFATFINGWRTFVITKDCDTSYFKFLKIGNDGSVLSMTQKAFRGWNGTVAKQGLMTGSTFAALDIVESKLMPRIPESTSKTSKKIIKSVCAGGLAALPVALLDTALVHQQGINSKNFGLLKTCRTILGEYGMKGFFRGSGFNSALLILGATLNAVFFDEIRQKGKSL